VDKREFLAYALGTSFVLAVMGAVAALFVLVVTAVPLLVILFPMTIGAVALVIAIGYLRRHRARRRRQTQRDHHTP